MSEIDEIMAEELTVLGAARKRRREFAAQEEMALASAREKCEHPRIGRWLGCSEKLGAMHPFPRMICLNCGLVEDGEGDFRWSYYHKMWIRLKEAGSPILAVTPSRHVVELTLEQFFEIKLEDCKDIAVRKAWQFALGG